MDDAKVIQSPHELKDSSIGKFGQEGRMLIRFESSLESRHQRQSIVVVESRRVEPEARKCRGAKDSVGPCWESDQSVSFANMPKNLVGLHREHEIFDDTRSFIFAKLCPEIYRSGTPGHFDHQLWCSMKRPLNDSGSTSIIGQSPQERIGLDFVFIVEDGRDILAGDNSKRPKSVEIEPRDRETADNPVTISNGTGHENNSPDEFGVNSGRHRGIRFMKSSLICPLAGDQGGDGRSVDGAHV